MTDRLKAASLFFAFVFLGIIIFGCWIKDGANRHIKARMIGHVAIRVSFDAGMRHLEQLRNPLKKDETEW